MRLYKFIDDPNGNPVLESFPVDQSEDKYQTVFWVTGEEMEIEKGRLDEGVAVTPQDAWEHYRQIKEDEIDGNEEQIESLKQENDAIRGAIDKALQQVVN